MFITTDFIALLPAWNRINFLALLEVKATRNGKKKWQEVNCGQELGLSLREGGMTQKKAKAAGQELHKEVSSLAMAWIIVGFSQKAPFGRGKIPFWFYKRAK